MWNLTTPPLTVLSLLLASSNKTILFVSLFISFSMHEMYMYSVKLHIPSGFFNYICSVQNLFQHNNHPWVNACTLSCDTILLATKQK